MFSKFIDLNLPLCIYEYLDMNISIILRIPLSVYSIMMWPYLVNI